MPWLGKLAHAFALGTAAVWLNRGLEANGYGIHFCDLTGGVSLVILIAAGAVAALGS